VTEKGAETLGRITSEVDFSKSAEKSAEIRAALVAAGAPETVSRKGQKVRVVKQTGDTVHVIYLATKTEGGWTLPASKGRPAALPAESVEILAAS